MIVGTLPSAKLNACWLRIEYTGLAPIHSTIATSSIASRDRPSWTSGIPTRSWR